LRRDRCSPRYLELKLAEHIGLSAKPLAKLVRFSRAIEEIRSRQIPDWAQVAQRCGFYQAHFNKEFRRFTAATPTAFLASRDPVAERCGQISSILQEGPPGAALNETPRG
jgi:AraC-like DNA-binding protein